MTNRAEHHLDLPAALRSIIIATRNAHKLREFEAMLAPVGVEVKALPEGVPEAPETGNTFLDNARQKAWFYAERVGGVVLADDSGLAVEALGGEPGVFSARYAGRHGDDSANNRKLLQRLQGIPLDKRVAWFHCAIVVADPRSAREWSAEGSVRGLILHEPQGSGGFGYDPLFWLPELGCSMAELAPEEKNAVSHRRRALEALIREWEREFGAHRARQ
jgi:XTP/dITP diphosphohydrolase